VASPLLPRRGIMFWPVGTGDSTTIVVDDDHVVQVDLHDMAKADDAGAVVTPVVDVLAACLPKRDGKPYLSVFVLTHADLDHCCGFADLLKAVTIGELWATPRLWREYQDSETVICDDARAFQKEAERRVKATRAAVARGERPASGDRILVVGYDSDREQHAYADLPAEYLTGPGHVVTSLDGDDVVGLFEAFIHAPFKDDCAAARNETSLALQVTLRDASGADGRVLLLGDLAHDTIMKIFDYSEAHDREERVAWDVLLAPHHCSKYVMYAGGELQQDVLDAFERHARHKPVIVASSDPVPGRNDRGDNPPHATAKARYLQILDSADQFICTQEWPSEDAPAPVVFALGGTGLQLLDPSQLDIQDRASAGMRKQAMELAVTDSAVTGVLVGLAAAALVALARRLGSRRAAPAPRQDREPGLDRAQRAVTTARGSSAAPRQPVGFGRA
jgi:beta-lactamase superfamily II metal-dependent hydrolase